MAKRAEDLYHPLRAAMAMGIDGHPLIQPFLEQSVHVSADGVEQVLGSTLRGAKAVKKVVYHVDEWSRFAQRDVKQPPPPEHAEKAHHLAHEGPTLAALKGKYALVSLRSRVSDLPTGVSCHYQPQTGRLRRAQTQTCRCFLTW